ncbi:MAG: NAD(P)-dependent oxidoreductase [Bacteroidales bacterium]|nr:NAD(P)-dependent oxidoreductase [Bacteroidales bacterium]
MKFIIFGGNGFVGRFLANKLSEQGKKVLIVDKLEEMDQRIKPQCDFLSLDIRDYQKVEQIDIKREDILINLAANQYHTKVPRDRKTYFFVTNTGATRNILEAAYNKGCSNIILFSTDMIYGKPLYLPVDTKHPQNPFGPYGQSKKVCEEICREYRKKGLNITIFRPRMIVGPGRLGILEKLFKLIDWNLPVPTIGNGKNHYQMISVFDCVDAILCAIEKGIPNNEYNLGSKLSPDITTLLKGVIKSAKSHSFVMHTPGKLVKSVLTLFDKMGLTIMYPEQFMIADEEYVLDISETEKDLEWSPIYNDEDMLKEAYRMYERSNK